MSTREYAADAAALQVAADTIGALRAVCLALETAVTHVTEQLGDAHTLAPDARLTVDRYEEALHQAWEAYGEVFDAVTVARPQLPGSRPVGVTTIMRGLRTARDGDRTLIEALLTAMAQAEADFTQTFRALAEGTALPEMLTDWQRDWEARLAAEDATPADRRPTMQRTNPAIIPRNHRVEAAISAANAGDFAPFHALTEALAEPWDAPPDSPFRTAPEPAERVTQTFCGT